MSTGSGITDHERYAEDAAAYAMAALEPAEAHAFRRHLNACAICQEDVISFSSTVSALAMAVPQYATPRALRRRVVCAARDEPVSEPQRARAQRAQLRLAVTGACAAVLAVAAVVGGVQLGGGRSHVYAAALGDAAVKVSGDRAELIVKHLPQPGPGKIYEVWFKHGSGTPKPTRALFGVSKSGTSDVVIPGSVHGVSTVMVTAEPDGGSQVPSSDPVIVASLT